MATTLPRLHPVCETRTDLLDRLAVAVERLGRAKLSLEEREEDDSPLDVQIIRSQVDGLRRELAWHRMSHGC